jgi:hypothetical protein
MNGSSQEQQGSTQQPAAAASLIKGLVVYRARDGEQGELWANDFGSLQVPEGWEFLPRGDAFITRHAKMGPHWVLKGKYNKKGGYRPVVGVFAPTVAIEAARATAEATKDRRLQARPKAAERREKVEAQYRQAFREACLRFLDFAPAHLDLAQQIAANTTDWACQKLSGRVGRTSSLSLEGKAALAVRAYVRHRCTDYESNLPDPDDYFADEAYREARAFAHEEVDQFLENHRART